MGRSEQVDININSYFNAQGINQFQNALMQITGLNNTLIGGLSKLAAGMNTLGATAGKAAIGMAAVGVAVVATTKAVISGVSAFAQFQNEMLKIKTVSGATVDQMKEFETTVRNIALASIYTTSQLNEASLEMAKLGVSGEDAMKNLPAITNLATASQEKLQVALEVGVKTMNSFGMEAENMGYISDVLSMGMNKTGLSLQGFNDAVQYVGATSKVTGVDIETMTKHLGILSDRGQKASRSGRLLSNIYVEMADKGSLVNKFLQEHGIKGETVDEKIRGLTKTGISASDAFQLFGKDTGKLAAVLFNSGDSIEKLDAEFQNLEGTTRRIAQEQLGSWVNQWKVIGNYVSDISLMIGYIVTPIVEAVTSGGQLAELFGQTKMQAGGLSELVRVVWSLMTHLTQEGGMLDDIMKGIGVAVDFVLTGIIGLAKMMGTTLAMTDFWWKQLMTIVKLVSGALGVAWENTISSMGLHWDNVVNAFKIGITEIQYFFSDMWDYTKIGLATVGVAIGEVVSKIPGLGNEGAQIKDFWTKYGAEATKHVEASYQKRGELEDTYFAKIEENTKKLDVINANSRQVMADLGKEAWNEMKATASNTLDGILDIWAGKTKELPAVDFIKPDNNQIVKDLVDAGKKGGKAFGEGFKEGVFDAQAYTKTFIEKVIEDFGQGGFLASKAFMQNADGTLANFEIKSWVSENPFIKMNKDYSSYQKEFVDKVREGSVKTKQEIQELQDAISGTKKTGKDGKEVWDTMPLSDPKEVEVAFQKLAGLYKTYGNQITQIHALTFGEGFEGKDKVAVAADKILKVTGEVDNLTNSINEYYKKLGDYGVKITPEMDKAGDELIKHFENQFEVFNALRNTEALREKAYQDGRVSNLKSFSNEYIEWIKKVQMAGKEFGLADFGNIEKVKSPTFRNLSSGEGQGAGASFRVADEAMAKLGDMHSLVMKNANEAAQIYRAGIDEQLNLGNITYDEHLRLLQESSVNLQNELTIQGDLYTEFYNAIAEMRNDMILNNISQTLQWVDQAKSMIFSVMDTVNAGKQKMYENDRKKAKETLDKQLADTRISENAKNELRSKYEKESAALEDKLAKESTQRKMKMMWVDTAIKSGMFIVDSILKYGPVAGPIVGAIGAGLMLANAAVAQSNANKYGLANGGIVGDADGATRGPDNNFNTPLRDGEMVLNADQQATLLDIARGNIQSTARGIEQVVIQIGELTNDKLSDLESMLYDLQSNGRFKFN